MFCKDGFANGALTDCCGGGTAGAGRASKLIGLTVFVCTPDRACCGRYTGGAGRVSSWKLLTAFNCALGALDWLGRYAAGAAIRGGVGL